MSTARGREVNIHLLWILTGALFNGNSLISLSAISWNGTDHYTGVVHKFKTFSYSKSTVKYKFYYGTWFQGVSYSKSTVEYKFIMVHDFKLTRHLVFQEHSKNISWVCTCTGISKLMSVLRGPLPSEYNPNLIQHTVNHLYNVPPYHKKQYIGGLC